jgi:nitrite reductase/ring-hydroxylating ferredoxin subunit
VNVFSGPCGGDLIWHRAIKSDSVGSRLVRVEVEGVQLLVGRLIGGEVVAVTPDCPHQGRPMDGGSLYSDMVACPHHQYTYDACTGENRYPKSVWSGERKSNIKGISVYPARDDGDWVWVGLPPCEQ